MVGSRPLRAGCPQRPGDSLDPITAWPRPVDHRAGGAQRSCANDCDGSWDGMMTEQANERRLGWLGTGRMGSELVRRLLAAGCDVAVYNRTKAKAEPLAAAGAKIVDSAAELAGRDIVFVTVGTSRDLVDALTGPAGLLSSAAAPGTVVDCSTISAEASQQVREQLGARGSELLAAPVMGNPTVARAGQLTFAVSGPRPAFDAAQPYLDLLGAGATYVGEGELARIVKLCHNLFLGVVTQSLAEVTGLAAARDREVPLPVASLVHQLVQSLVGHGLGQSDFAALLVLQARSAGLELVSEDANVSDGLEPASLTGGEETP